MKERLIVGISGASGAPIALALLQALKKTSYETHVILSGGGEMTLRQECRIGKEELSELCDVLYDIHDLGAGPASGSFRTAGMVIVPCSMKTAAGLYSGYSDNLLLRAGDVTMKERRKLVLVPRECPLSTIHLRNLYELSQMGAVILPPMMGYYYHPRTMQDEIDFLVGKILDQFGVEAPNFRRWEGMT